MISIPQLDDPQLKKLIRLVNPSSKPIYVAVRPEVFAIKNECFPAVKEKIKRDGGSQMIGWQVWKSDILIEAEFHAVWKSPNGNLVDITPKTILISNIVFSNIVFLPDLKMKYTGAQVDNIRLNITGNSLVDDFIEISKAKFRLFNKGDRTFENEIGLSYEECELLKKSEIFRRCLQIMAQNGMDKNSNCFCSSYRQYKNCCYKEVVELVKNMVSL